MAALQRMIEERGIRDPEGAKVKFDRDDVIQQIEYADKPLLAAPGKTLQTALLLDPVSTGVEDEERVLPSSNLGTFEISALHERRNLFKDNDHVPAGFSEERRNLNVAVAGSHSDIGNTYDKNGLGVLSFNLGVEFLNRLSDTPYLHQQAVPSDPAQFVVHRSDRHLMGLYGTQGYDQDGVRDRREDQSPRPGLQRKDPIDPELEKQVERREGPLSEPPDPSASFGVPQLRDPQRAGRPRSPADELFERAFSAYMSDNERALSEVMDQYRQSPLGQAWAQEQQQYSLGMREQERQAELQRQAEWAEQQQATRQRGPVLSL